MNKDPLSELLSQKAKLKAEIESIDKKIAERKSHNCVMCERCRRGYEIQDLEYIQTHYYVRPYSCTGGDYWTAGEGRWQCVECKHINRLYDKPDIAALKPYFKSVVLDYNE